MKRLVRSRRWRIARIVVSFLLWLLLAWAVLSPLLLLEVTQ
jgi:hypothetical protein